MINYEKFKELYEAIPGEPEFELYFNNTEDTYWIIKYADFVTFQKSGYDTSNLSEIEYKNLDELYNANLIDNINLKNDWKNISDIVIGGSFSVVDDKDDIEYAYKVKL
ncbi:MAG: hypothetical protein IKG27_05310 [Bacilli bacterium]|nr:hypothetical protein [Bacilli bacterium]